ncbi:copper(I)-binding protein [Rhizobium mesoamericanum]|uniref:copper chaperone PCu(A)C n=1 Tax=Rhizobium mesoamericanum TaxID=1079800 RepID=UPI00278725CA|nr:copper chaperone PCu(A)C [Rhizobium mesoamericanum]MDQ0559946.1 copper(I)-binding protein [Rhizobium mesoamericanum]
MKKLITLMTGLVFAGLFAAIATASDIKVGAIDISHPSTRAMVPGAKVGGGYLTLTNTGSIDDRLVTITSERAAKAEVHQMSVNNGVMTMRPVTDGLVIPAGQTIELKPGGYHIMFMDVAQPFKEGEMIKATMTFEKAGSVDVEFAVGRPGGANSSVKEHPSDMEGMDMSKPQ